MKLTIFLLFLFSHLVKCYQVFAQDINDSEWDEGLKYKVNMNHTYTVHRMCYYLHLFCPNNYILDNYKK